MGTKPAALHVLGVALLIVCTVEVLLPAAAMRRQRLLLGSKAKMSTSACGCTPVDPAGQELHERVELHSPSSQKSSPCCVEPAGQARAALLQMNPLKREGAGPARQGAVDVAMGRSNRPAGSVAEHEVPHAATIRLKMNGVDAVAEQGKVGKSVHGA